MKSLKYILSYVSVFQYRVLVKAYKSGLIEFCVFSIVNKHLDHFFFLSLEIYISHFLKNGQHTFQNRKKDTVYYIF